MNIPDYLHDIVSEAVNHECEGARMRRNWAVVLGLKIQQDGDQFCILWGDNLQTGVAGFGKTPVDAIYAFDNAMYAPVKQSEKNKLILALLEISAACPHKIDRSEGGISDYGGNGDDMARDYAATSLSDVGDIARRAME